MRNCPFDDGGPCLLKGRELHGRLLHARVHSLLFHRCVSAGSELHSWSSTLRGGEDVRRYCSALLPLPTEPSPESPPKRSLCIFQTKQIGTLFPTQAKFGHSEDMVGRPSGICKAVSPLSSSTNMLCEHEEFVSFSYFSKKKL